MTKIENPETFDAKAAIGHPRQPQGAVNQDPQRTDPAAGELFTYKRKNAVGSYDTRQAPASEEETLKADGWMRLDEITGNAADATAKPPTAAPLPK